MIVGGVFTNRPEEFGRQYEHEERREQRERAIDQAQTEHDRYRRDRERGEQIEHRTRELRTLQHLHRCFAKSLAHLVYTIRIRLRHRKGRERRQAAYRVDEMIRHDLECSMLNAALFGGGLTDEHHEQHHRRQKDDNDNARDPIGTSDGKREHERQDHHVHQLRQNELKILLHLIDAFERHGSARCGAEALR